MSDVRACPHCQRRLYFMPDGRSLYCEHCGYKQAEKKAVKRHSVTELAHAAKWIAPAASAAETISKNVRDLLIRGIAAAKAGDGDESYYYLERVLLTQSSEEQRAKAWLWLSGLYEDPAERRLCLEQVVAIEPTNPLARRGLAIIDGRLNPDDIIDPDKLEQTAVPDEPPPAEVEQFTCPRCNGRLNYTPDQNALACEFCDYQQEVMGEHVQQQYGMGEFEQDFIAAMHTKRGHLYPIAMRAFQCYACAVEFLLTPETISVTCPYCNSVYVTETAESRELLPPQALVPFAISLKEAEKALRTWFQQHNINRPRLSPIVGIYMPLWTFDIGGTLTWRGEVRRGDTWEHRSGDKVIFYDDVPAFATQKLPCKLATNITSSFDLSQLVPYDARYLADWPAERYQIALGDAAIQARKYVLTQLRRNPYELTHSEAFIRHLHVGTSQMVVESFKQVLLPLWMASYMLEGKRYDVIVNGQTAVIFGQGPEGIVGKFFIFTENCFPHINLSKYS